MQIRGAILDFDGTLLDSIDAWHDLDRRYLEKYQILNEENLNAMENSSTIEYAADYLLSIGFSQSRQEIIAEINSMIRDAYLFHLPLFPGVTEFIKSKRSAGWKLGLLTAAPRPLVMAALKRLKIHDAFDTISCDADKHSGEPFLRMAATLGLTPQETIVYDDQPWVLKLASHLGFNIEAQINSQNA